MEASEMFDNLLEKADDMKDGLQIQGANAFTNGKMNLVRSLAQQLEEVDQLICEINQLREHWLAQFPEVASEHQVRQVGSRTPAGERTPEILFHLPLLSALVKLGGKGTKNQVNDLVGDYMKDILNEVDKEHLPSENKEIRWRNAVAWLRFKFIQKGYLIADSPYGLWEISDKGVDYLKQLESQQ